MNIGIYIYDDAEVLDFSGPFEVFATAARLVEPPAPFRVFMVGETGEAVSARAGYKVTPDYGFADHPAIDVLVVVGGVHIAEMTKPPVLTWIKENAERAQIIASVCTGAFLLAEAGVLVDNRVTTHWEDIPDLKARYPKLQVVENQRWVDEGTLITSGGISAGIDMSLHLVSKIHSMKLAERTARQMEFDWTKNGESRDALRSP